MDRCEACLKSQIPLNDTSELTKEKETDLQKELMVAGGQEEGFRKG